MGPVALRIARARSVEIMAAEGNVGIPVLILFVLTASAVNRPVGSRSAETMAAAEAAEAASGTACALPEAVLAHPTARGIIVVRTVVAGYVAQAVRKGSPAWTGSA